MPQLVLGTKNPDKLREIKILLRDSSFKVFSLNEFCKCPDVVENGRTFEANARKKARFYSQFTQSLALADDSGLVVPYLNGRPGVYSARFAGSGCSYRDNNKKLLHLMMNAKGISRQAKFVCVMALYDRGKLVKTLRGECRGKISFEARGKNGFGYDPVFIPKGFSKTFSELSLKTKNKISHRGKALRLAKKLLLSKFGRLECSGNFVL